MQKLKYENSAVDLTDLALGIVVLGVIVSVGATVLLNVRDTHVTNTPGCNETHTEGCGTAYNLSNSAAEGLGEYGNWFKILVIVGVAAVVLSLIFMAFGRASTGTSY